VSLQTKGITAYRVVQLTMGCHEKAFWDCARLIMGYLGAESKAGKWKHQGTPQDEKCG